MKNQPISMKIQQTRGEVKIMRTLIDINKLNENHRKPMHVHGQMNIGGPCCMLVRRPTEAIEQQCIPAKTHEHLTKQQTTIILRKQMDEVKRK